MHTFFNITNIVCVAIVVASWFIFIKTTLSLKILNEYPLSIFILIGFLLTQQYFPLLFTLLEGKALTNNLQVPYDVFIHSFLILITLIVAHIIYRHNFTRVLTYLRNIFYKLGCFTPPLKLQLWLMGFVGLASMFYVHILTKTSWEVTGSAINKIFQALIPFSYAPFLILLSRLYDIKENKLTNKLIIQLSVYLIILFVLGMGRNSRSIFILGFTVLGFNYGLGLLLNIFKIPAISLQKLIIYFFAFLIVNGPIADISTAMVLVRAQRNDTSTLDLITQTFETYFDKDAIAARRTEDLNVEKFDWNENYLDNIFLARFCNIKYNDISLAEASLLEDNDDDMLQFSYTRVMLMLPAPVLTFFGFTEDKNSHNYSFGDLLHAKTKGEESSIGGYRTGHLAGTGMAAFGWWYLILLLLCMLIVFLFVDSLYIQLQSVNRDGIQMRFNVSILLGMTFLFLLLTSESVVIITGYIMRGWFQDLILYLMLFHITRFIALFVQPTNK